jgi:2,5-diamino-6-(ribosylamino)-4(3H)-pyrimidinone 5'-phosphate reductase
MNRPFVFINVAMTADGKIDTVARKGAAISSARDKERVNALRAESDAVMVGGKTLLAEDPKLTVKSESLRAERVARGLAPNPIKVGIVSDVGANGHSPLLDPHSKFIHEGGARVVIFTTNRTSKDKLEILRSQGVDVFVHASKRVDLERVMQTLNELGVKRLMVEGGATLNFELLRLGLVDEVSAFIAPMIFGGESAPTMVAGAGWESAALSESKRGGAVHLKLKNVERWDDGGVLIQYLVERSL